MDGAGSKSEDRVLIVGATNLPNELDKAALRRFTKKVLIDLPDFKARKAMISKLLSKTQHRLTESDISEAAHKLERKCVIT